MKKLLLYFFVLIAVSSNAQAPQMSYPKSGLDTVAVKFIYWWQHVSGGVAYKIECDTTNQFNSPLKRTLLANDAAIASTNPGSNVFFLDSNYLYNVQYYWKIKTLFTNDSSTWSPTESFKTRQAIDIIYPGDFANTTPSTFFIAHIAGSTGYELQVNTDPIFTNPIYIYKTISNYSNFFDKQSVMIPGTGYTPNTTYNWRVRGYSAVDSTEWSKTYTFTTKVNSNSILELNESNFIYPNPAADKLYINNSKNCTLVIFDMQGKVIEKVIADAKYILNVSNYSNGLYILQIIEDDKAIGLRKFSVIR